MPRTAVRASASPTLSSKRHPHPPLPNRHPQNAPAALHKRVIHRKLCRSSKRLRYSLCSSSAGLLPMYFARQRRRLRVDHMKLMHQTVAISSMTFNLNTYSDLRCLKDFRFRLKEIQQILDAIGWHTGKTRRCGNKCSAVTATCILLRRLAYPCRLVDLELTFGMHSSALSEIFWEAIESLYQTEPSTYYFLDRHSSREGRTVCSRY